MWKFAMIACVEAMTRSSTSAGPGCEITMATSFTWASLFSVIGLGRVGSCDGIAPRDLDHHTRGRTTYNFWVAMPIEFDRMLRSYAELTVKVGLNLQPHQRLLIIGPVANGGCSLEAAPLVRQITAAAYRHGARLVKTLWGDEALLGARLTHAPRDSFAEFSAWLPGALVQHVEAGHAVLSIYANDPDQLKNYPPELVAA